MKFLSNRSKTFWRVLIAIFTLALFGAVIAFAQPSASTQTVQSGISEETIRNQRDQLKWKKDQVANWRREASDIKRDCANCDPTAALNAVSQFETCVNELEAFVGGTDEQVFWDKNQTCNDLNSATDDFFRDLRTQRDCAQRVKSAKEREKELGRGIQDQLRNIKRNDPNVDVSQVNTLVAEIQNLLSQIPSTVATCTEDTAATAWGFEQDVNDKFNVLYQDVLQPLNEKANLAQGKKELTRHIKNRERELGDMTREFNRVKGKSSPAIVEQLQAIFVKGQEILERFRTCVNDPNLQNAQDCWDIDRDWQDALQDPENGFWQILQKANQEQDIARCKKERPREHAQNLRQVKDLRREEKRLVGKLGDAAAELTQCINTYEQAVNEAAKYIESDQCNEYWTPFSNLEPIAGSEFGNTPPGGCWDIMNALNVRSDSKRRINDLRNEAHGYSIECKRLTKETKRFGGDASEICSLSEQFTDLFEQFVVAVGAGKFDEIQEIDTQMNDVRMNLQSGLAGFWDRNRDLGMCMDVGNIKQEIADGKQELEKLRQDGKVDEELYATCKGFIEKGEFLIGKAGTACEADDHPTIDKVMKDLDFLGAKAEVKCAILFEEEAESVRYEDYNFETIKKDKFDEFANRFSEKLQSEVFENVIARVQEQLIQKLMEKLETSLEERLKAALITTIQNMALVNPDISQEIVQNKLQAIDCVSSVKELSARPGGEGLREIMPSVEDATPVGESARRLKDACDGFVLQAKELRGEELKDSVARFVETVKSVLASALQEAVAQGVTCAVDVPVGQWYHPEMCGTINKSVKFIEGGRGGFEPGRNVNMAEVLKITARLFNITPPRGCPTTSGISCTQWFAPYVLWAEKENLSIVKQIEKFGAGAPAPRGLVIRTILEVAHEKIGENDTPYTDVPVSHANAAYIARATELRIVAGTEKNGKRLFFPDREVLRGEMARIANNAFLVYGERESDVFEDTEDEGGATEPIPMPEEPPGTMQ